MPVLSPFTLKNGPGQFEPGQTKGSIKLPAFRGLIDSLAGIYGTAPHTTSYIPTDTSDAGCVVEMSSSSPLTFTIPHSSSVAYDVHTVIEIFQGASGSVSVIPANGVTILSPTGSSVTRAQYSTIAARHRAQNVWIISGDTTTASSITGGIGIMVIGVTPIG